MTVGDFFFFTERPAQVLNLSEKMSLNIYFVLREKKNWNNFRSKRIKKIKK